MNIMCIYTSNQRLTNLTKTHTQFNSQQKKKGKICEKNKVKITWVTSAEVTHIITTAAIKNKPALYLQPMNVSQI